MKKYKIYGTKDRKPSEREIRNRRLAYEVAAGRNRASGKQRRTAAETAEDRSLRYGSKDDSQGRYGQRRCTRTVQRQY